MASNHSKRVILSVVVGMSISGMPLLAQSQTPESRASNAFATLELPTPTPYRTGAGTPGPMYWQQRADYSISAALDTTTHTLLGEETIRYWNNSPDTLRFLWLNLEQNLRAPDNPHAALGRSFDEEPGLTGVVITRLGVRGPLITGQSTALRALPYRIDGTLMYVPLPDPLPPQRSLELDIAWHFRLPEQFWGAGRKRYAEGWLYQVGQWYPRMVVYDDVRGWNTDQYLGRGEFYLEYGDFDYAITVPASYTVAGSGLLTNPDDVLTPEQQRRLDAARTASAARDVISRNEAGHTGTALPSGRTRTWRFRAANVRDVAWSAAPNFVWRAMGADGVLVQALYPNTAPRYWDETVEMVRHTIEFYSAVLLRYPYPVITITGGPSGEEYPMLSFVSEAVTGDPGCPKCGPGPQGPLFEHLAHEVSHQWFPMIVGSNERRYGWQDEGLTMLLNLQQWRVRFPDDSAYHSARYEDAAGQFSADGWTEWLHEFRGVEGNIMMSQDEAWDRGVGYMHYIKVPIGLRFLRHEVVDSVAFDRALREYVRRWAFKHPTPADFFRTVDNTIGHDLSWFWRSWFYRSDRLDFAIDSVVQRDSGDVVISIVHLSSRGAMVAPVELQVKAADSSITVHKLPVEVWQSRSRYEYQFPTDRRARPVEIEIDHRHVYPDIERGNNKWRPRR